MISAHPVIDVLVCFFAVNLAIFAALCIEYLINERRERRTQREVAELERIFAIPTPTSAKP